ncbi:ionotropic receptor 100a [Haematobia irritans]|uniref:ionotropic receptor 100a n=1 Tax=Haematobia irritans TaxID=7368 RepID=UPI003F5045C5
MFECTDMQELSIILENQANRAGYLFLLLANDTTDWSDIFNKAQYFWNTLRIYKIIYMANDVTQFYHPFVNDEQGNYGRLVNIREYNINNIFHNMNGYTLRVYIFDSVFSSVLADGNEMKVTGVKGTEANVAYLLEQYLNFSMYLQWPDDDFFGARLENGSFNGAIGRLERNETDISLTGFFIKDYLARGIDFSASVYMDKLCCYVKKSQRIPASILPLYAVHESIWLVYVIVGTLSSFFWMLLRRVNLRLNSEELMQVKSMRFEWYVIFTDTWVLWVRMIITRFPPSNAERIFAISLCLVSVIIGAIIDSSLATVYIEPLYYKDINTLAELEKAHMRIFYKHAAIRDDLFTGHSSEIYQSLDRRMILVGEPEERLISIMAKRGGFVAVTRAASLDLVDIYYFVTKKVFMIPECPKLYNIAFPMMKNSPYEEEINLALTKFLAAGLINYWIEGEKYKSRSRIHLFQDYVAESEHKWKVLSIVDLQLAFYVLATGSILSAILFCGEFIHHSYRVRRKQLIQRDL